MEKEKSNKAKSSYSSSITSWNPLLDVLLVGAFSLGLGLLLLNEFSGEDFEDNKIAEKKIADILAKNSNSKSNCISELSSEVRTERLSRKRAEKKIKEAEKSIKELELTILNLKNELKNN